MCAKNHTCVAKTTHVWNLPLKKSYLKWLDKSTHVWEKPLSICVLTKWKKPNMCGFYQTHTKYKCVWKKPHMCVKRQQRSARILDPGNSRRESASFFLALPQEMIFWSLDLVSKHESNKMESRSRLEIREWSYDNLDHVSPRESKKNNSQSRLEKLHFLSRVRVRF